MGGDEAGSRLEVAVAVLLDEEDEKTTEPGVDVKFGVGDAIHAEVGRADVGVGEVCSLSVGDIGIMLEAAVTMLDKEVEKDEKPVEWINFGVRSAVACLAEA